MQKPNLNEKKLNLFFIVLFTIWMVSLFLAPIVTSPGIVVNLNGHSTLIDYSEKWDDLPIYVKTIYLIGDILCHQKFDRSILINGNQMPVCSRCMAVYLGFLLGLIFTLYVPNNMEHKKYITFILPKKFRKKTIEKLGLEFLPVIIISLFLIPVAIDGTLQLLTSYESSHFLRIITGIPAGWIGGIVLGSLVNT